MKIRILGCSGAEIPGFKTMSFLINSSVLLDAGAATSSLTMKEQEEISDILITHSHLDHIKDVLFLADNLVGRPNKPINLITTSEIISIIQGSFLNNSVWPDFTIIPTITDPIIRFKPIEAEKEFRIDHLTVKAVEVNHTVKAVGYFIRDGDSAILHSGDTGPTERLWQIANETENLKAIFIETSFPNEMQKLAEVSKHLTPNLLNDELKKLKKRDVPIYIIHMKPQYIDTLKKELRAIGDSNIHFLEQGQELEF